jgi:formate hydrogenlyase subunit 3/multisubunit Na+/H+ antiporter MnhD subunit
VYKAYFEEASPTSEEVREAPWIVAPLAVSAAASLILGLYPVPVLELAGRAMQ